jgi:hypothetical protein
MFKAIAFGLNFYNTVTPKCPARALLDHVADFVGNQLSSTPRAGVVLALPEKDVPTSSERLGADLLVEGIGLRVSVCQHCAEIMTQHRLHLRLDGAVQRLPTAAGSLDSRLHTRSNRASLESHPGDIQLRLEFFFLFLLRKLLALNISRLPLHLKLFLVFLTFRNRLALDERLGLNLRRCSTSYADCTQAVTQPGGILQQDSEVGLLCLTIRHDQRWLPCMDRPRGGGHFGLRFDLRFGAHTALLSNKPD